MSCNSQDKPSCPTTTTSSVRNKVIVGDLDWQEIIELGQSTPERENSYAIGEIVIPAIRTTCTAFLIAPDVIMTNNHCVESKANAAGVTLTLLKEKGVPMERWWKYTCDEFIGTSFEWDMTLLRCKNSPGEIFGTVELTEDVYKNDLIYVVQQNCNYYVDPYCYSWKKISRGQALVVTSSDIRHNADTLGGSSGSPLFSALTNTVVGLHHQGENPDPITGHGTANYAVTMSKILSFIKNNYSNVELGKIFPKMSEISNVPTNPTPSPNPAPSVTPTPAPTASPIPTPVPTIPGEAPCSVI